MRYVVVTLNLQQFRTYIDERIEPREIERRMMNQVILKNGDSYIHVRSIRDLRGLRDFKAIYTGQYYMLKELREMEDYIKHLKLKEDL